MDRILARLKICLGNNGASTNVSTSDLKALLSAYEVHAGYPEFIEEFQKYRASALQLASGK